MWNEMYRNEGMQDIGGYGNERDRERKNENITYKNLQCQLTNHDA
jgi:hypothetical protein